MVDRVRRNKLAFYLRQLSVGLISNDEFEDAILTEVSYGWLPEQYYRAKESKFDDAVMKPMLVTCWGLYSDLKEHKLKGSSALSKESLKIIARCILFLRSDNEYRWPEIEWRHPVVRLSFSDLLLIVVTLGAHYLKHKLKCEQQYRETISVGDYNVWPFLKVADYDREINNPHFLSA